MGQVSRDGSATVQWSDAKTVHIRNFYISSDGTLWMNSYDGGETSPGGWNTQSTPFGGGVDVGKDTSIAAVNINPFASNQQIYVFFPVAGQMQLVILNVASGTWVQAQDFNRKGFSGVPRTAVSWMDSNGNLNIRVYFVKNVDKILPPGADQPTYVNEMWEIAYQNSVWQYGNNSSAIRKFNQIGDPFGNSVAAITWGNGSQIRLYYYEVLAMVELIWNAQNPWVLGSTLSARKRHLFMTLLIDYCPSRELRLQALARDEQTFRYPMTALQFVSSSGNQLRVYRNTPRQFSKNQLDEWAFDESSGKWTVKALPHDLIKGTDGSAQPSAVVWTYPDPSQAHIRLYQFKDGNFITEQSFDQGSGWKANTATLGK